MSIRFDTYDIRKCSTKEGDALKNRIVASLLCVVITSAMIISSTSQSEAQANVVQVDVQGAVQVQSKTEQEQAEEQARVRAQAEAVAKAEAEAKAKTDAEEKPDTEIKTMDGTQPEENTSGQTAATEDGEAGTDAITGTGEITVANSAFGEKTGELQDSGSAMAGTENEDGSNSDTVDQTGDKKEETDVNPSDEVVSDDSEEENFSSVVDLPEKNPLETVKEQGKIGQTVQSASEGSAAGILSGGTAIWSGSFLTGSGLAYQVGQLKNEYHLSFATNFADVMKEIETQYREEYKLDESVTAVNWQDMIAVYAMSQNRRGITDVTLNENSKEELLTIFGEMNVPMMVGDEVRYSGDSVVTYMANHSNELSDRNRRSIQDYTSSDCTLLCAAVTSADPLVLQSIGDGIEGGQSGVVRKAFELVGKVSYFWGGKSSVIGWDNRWGGSAAVTASGSKYSGSVRPYGLDCSGYVAWVFANAYGNSAAISYVGQGTAEQWANSVAVPESQAQPGDLVFLKTPGIGINHVGIIVGQEANGEWLVSHCSSSKGVNISTASSVGFRYVRRPLIYGV